MFLDHLDQVEISDRLHRDLPAPLAAQTAHTSLLIGVQRGLQAGRSERFRKIKAVDHDHHIPGAYLSMGNVAAQAIRGVPQPAWRRAHGMSPGLVHNARHLKVRGPCAYTV